MPTAKEPVCRKRSEAAKVKPAWLGVSEDVSATDYSMLWPNVPNPIAPLWTPPSYSCVLKSSWVGAIINYLDLSHSLSLLLWQVSFCLCPFKIHV